MTADHLLRLELDVDTGTDDQFALVAMEWLDDGTRLLEPELRQDLDEGTWPVLREPADPDEPWGPPGAASGLLMVSRKGATRLDHQTRPASTDGWRWLRGQLSRPPFAATVMLHRLGPDGMPASRCDLRIAAHPTAPGWARLTKDLPSRFLTAGDRALERQALWVSFLRAYADRLNPAYGQIGVSHNGGATTLETCLPFDGGRNLPWQSIVGSRRYLRGYGWLTILAEEMIEPLGGVDRIAASGVFHEVARLRAGGLWLRATDNLSDYDLLTAEQVFDVVAPVLRPGQPEPPSPDPRTGLPRDPAPYLLVFEDALERASRHRK